MKNYEDVLESVYSCFLQKGDGVIDIGAHTGRHTKPLSKIVCDNGEVLAFEPIPDIREKLKQKFKNNNNIHILPYALSDKNGHSEFVLAKDRLEESGLVQRVFNGKTSIERIEVEIKELDNIVEFIPNNLRFIKLDTEGAEYNVLKGARGIMEKYKPIVAFEFGELSYSAYDVDPNDVYNYFDSLNYKIYSILGDSLTKEEFVKESKVQKFWDYIACFKDHIEEIENAFDSVAATKVIVVTPWFGEFAGGAEVLAKSLAVELNKRGVETLVFSTCCKSPYSEWWENYYEETQYEVYGLKTFRFKVNETKQRYQSAIQAHVKNNMTQKQKEDFFVAGINSDNLVKALKPYIENGYEVIAMPYFQGLSHSVVNTYPNKVSITPCFHDEEPFYWKPIETLLKNAKHIFYNSPEEKRLTIKNYGHKIGRKVVTSTVSGVGVELKKAILPKEVDIPENYFIYMGRKEKGKNVHLLIKWFKNYIKENKDYIKLVFIGGGDSSLIPKDDAFIDFGFVTEEEKSFLVQNARGLINLSENESFSIVMMEAWLNKTAVITHGECEVTKGHCIKSNGGLYPSNQEEFILCLDYFMGNQDDTRIMGQNGYRYVKNNYNFDTVLEKYLEILENK